MQGFRVYDYAPLWVLGTVPFGRIFMEFSSGYVKEHMRNSDPPRQTEVHRHPLQDYYEGCLRKSVFADGRGFTNLGVSLD